MNGVAFRSICLAAFSRDWRVEMRLSIMLAKCRPVRLACTTIFISALLVSGCGGSSGNQQILPPAEEDLPENDAPPLELVRTQCGSSMASMLVAGDAVESAPSIVPPFSVISSTSHHVGSLSGSSTNSDVDYWGFRLTPDNYKLVIDLQNPNSVIDPTEVVIQFIGQFTGSSGQPLEFTSLRQSSRYFVNLNVTQALVSLTLAITTENTTLDYQFALVREGSDLPSPRFVNCPDVTRTAIGNTEVINLGVNTEEWMLLEIPAGASAFPIDVVSNDPGSSTVGIELYFSEIGSDNESVMITQTLAAANGAELTLDNSVGGDVFLRFVNSGPTGVVITLDLVE